MTVIKDEKKYPQDITLRGKIWKIFLQIPTLDKDEYIKLVQSDIDTKSSIIVDVERTFNQDSLFTTRVKPDQLIRVLNSWQKKTGIL